MESKKKKETKQIIEANDTKIDQIKGQIAKENKDHDFEMQKMEQKYDTLEKTS